MISVIPWRGQNIRWWGAQRRLVENGTLIIHRNFISNIFIEGLIRWFRNSFLGFPWNGLLSDSAILFILHVLLSERTCGAPMFGFCNQWQSLWTNGCLEIYLKDLSIGFSWSTFVGFKESLWWPRCYSRNYLKIGLVRGWSRLSKRVNQVDQHTKRRRCTERDQAIPWYGKHCQLRFVY